jgi:hypothetical protein
MDKGIPVYPPLCEWGYKKGNNSKMGNQIYFKIAG